MSHACGPYTVEGFMDGRGPKARLLWDHLLATVGAFGPFDFAPAKTRVALMVRVRFLAVTALSDRGLTFHLWLRSDARRPEVFRLDELGPKAVIHWIRATSPEDIDAVVDLIGAAYRIGTGES